MPRYSAAQIYGFARQAGFDRDEAATMTAIALAESGGNSRAHNPYGEDSRGLWQINARAHPELARRGDLYDPLDNARAAFRVSRGGADVSPWTVTHHGDSARYLRYREAAQAAAVAYGDGPGRGVWTGTEGYGHPLPAGHGGGLSGAAGAALAGDGGAGDDGAGDNAALEAFMDAAHRQLGDDYVFGATPREDDPDPESFDCSSFVQWAADQAGVEDLPRTAAQQYLFLKDRGMLISPEEGARTEGALLFTFATEPVPGGGEPQDAHVAISTGDGRTIEAQNPQAGVGTAEAGDRFQYAALIPGISDGSATPAPGVPAADPVLLTGGPDSDSDGITDLLEIRLGTDPGDADTDDDHLDDSYEVVTSGTSAARASSDGDLIADATELAMGRDPLDPDDDSDGHLDGAPTTGQPDTDADGLDDALERVLLLDTASVDTDADGFADRIELDAGTDPLDPRLSPLRVPAGDPGGAPFDGDDELLDGGDDVARPVG